MRPSKDDHFLLAQSTKDAEAGFCTPPMRHAALLREVRGAPFRLILRCAITQSSGKQRMIDNADAGGQSSLSSGPNKLTLCSPIRPAQHTALTTSAMSPDEFQAAQESDSWEGGGEDWPDAYRHCPMPREHALCCVVVLWHEEWGEPAYQVYTGLLFGLPLAVTSFNRWSRFVEAAGRRLTFTLVSAYFDDSHVSDWRSAKGSGQWAYNCLNEALGTPFAAAKKQRMAISGSFLGLEFDFSSVLTQGYVGYVSFFVRARLVEKVTDLIESARASNTLRAGVASKLYGMLNFLELGMFGRVGAGGLAAIKDRQMDKGVALTPALEESLSMVLESLSMVLSVLRVRPERQYDVGWRVHPRILAASDAAEDVPGCGTGGFHLVRFDAIQVRESFVAHVDAEVYSHFEAGDHKIAQLELSMVLYAVTTRPNAFRSRRGIWFIDNTAALMALIRGRSGSSDLERLSQLVHLCLFALSASLFWEWVPSKSNWADAISRMGYSDPWYPAHGFVSSLWTLPPSAVISVVQYL